MSTSREVANQLEPWSELKGKIVMVTGASSGLGKELCLDLSKAGCYILAVARRVDRLKSLCDQINQVVVVEEEEEELESTSQGQRCRRAVAVELDVSSDRSTIESAVKIAWDAFGRIDVLINNAGVRGGVHTPLDLSEEEWDHVMRTNLTGAWLVSKYVCILMRDAKLSGSIINISSISGVNRTHVRGGLAYDVSKTALNTLTKVMAQELGAFNIRVNSVSPDLFKSEITGNLLEKDWLKNVERKVVPLRTWGTMDPALTSLIRYLIHDSSRYVSGNIFIPDAGVTLPTIPIFSSL